MLALISIAIFIGSSMGRFLIREPSDLQDQFPSPIDYSISNFGRIPYGRTVTGEVYLYQDQESYFDLCSEVPLENRIQDKSQWFIVLRGNCTFTTKVKNAQDAGAGLVIIVDNKDEYTQQVVMVDDGRGFLVHIPSILISKDDGNRIMDFIKQNQSQQVSALIIFNDTYKTEKPNVIFGLNIENRETFKMIRHFKKFFDILKDKVDFSIFYEFQTCYDCAKNNFKQSNPDCLGGGRYCCMDPDSYGAANGADVVREQLRQICLFQQDPNEWFNYMVKFDQECIKAQLFSDCNKKLNQNSKLFQKMESCVLASFDKQNQDQQDLQVNSILEQQMIYKNSSGIIYYPGAVINNITYRGNLIAKDIFYDICSGNQSYKQYLQKAMINPPSECKMDENLNEKQSSGQSYTALIIVIIISCVLFIFFMHFVYRRILKKQVYEDMNIQVNQITSQYLNFYENQK